MITIVHLFAFLPWLTFGLRSATGRYLAASYSLHIDYIPSIFSSTCTCVPTRYPFGATSRAGVRMPVARGAGMQLNLVLKYVLNF